MQDISLNQQANLGVYQQQKLLMTTAMKQAFYVMQLPILELSEWVKTEIENNPALEIELPALDSSENDFSFHMNKTPLQNNAYFGEPLENLAPAAISLFDYLMSQARYHFHDSNDITLAQWIIGHLNDRGFLTSSLDELSTFSSLEKLQKILNVIQTFDPPGIAARTLQESLLIQLKLKQKERFHAYKIIEMHFEDLIHNRLPKISKELRISLEEISRIIAQDISVLDLHPGDRFLLQPTKTIVPDLFFISNEDTWRIEINDAFLPSFQIAPTYKNAIENNLLKPEEFAYLRRHFTAGKWLRHILTKRKTTLLNIGKFLLQNQLAFFQEGVLSPLKMSEAAEALGLHESTIARAVANKYIACPQGTFALKDFFNHGLRGQEGRKISHRTLRHKLKELIDGEDKKRPYSDEDIKTHLCTMGIPCARRTVTKYRKLLSIASASQRKRWF